MFGSRFEGERANAAALADKLVKENGLTWVDVIGQFEPTIKKGSSYAEASSRWAGNHRALAARILAEKRSFLTIWEREFLGTIPRFKVLTSKQKAVSEGIIKKTGMSP